MSELVKLVNEWDHFEKEHPQSSIEDFCRYYLIRKRQEQKEGSSLVTHNPPTANSTMTKVIGRIAGMMHVYLKIAYRDEKDIELEDAFFLNAIYIMGEPRKTDVINYNFTEQSTGIDILNRLKKSGYITERDAPDDKRAKLVKVTAKGEEKVRGFWERGQKGALILFSDIEEEDKKLVIQLLSPVENRHTQFLPEVRNKTIDEIMELKLGKEKATIALAEVKKRMESHRERAKGKKK